MFYPYNRGALFTALVVIYALTSGIAGYTASSFYHQLEGTNWVCSYKFSIYTYIAVRVGMILKDVFFYNKNFQEGFNVFLEGNLEKV